MYQYAAPEQRQKHIEHICYWANAKMAKVSASQWFAVMRIFNYGRKQNWVIVNMTYKVRMDNTIFNSNWCIVKR